MSRTQPNISLDEVRIQICEMVGIPRNPDDRRPLNPDELMHIHSYLYLMKLGEIRSNREQLDRNQDDGTV